MEKLEAPDWVLLARTRVESPHVDHSVLTTGDETGVVLQPGNPLDGLLVGHEFEVLGVSCGIELVHPDLLIVLASEQMATMGEHNLTTLLDQEALVGDELLVKNVHQTD